MHFTFQTLEFIGFLKFSIFYVEQFKSFISSFYGVVSAVESPIGEAGQLNMTDLTPDSLTRLS